MAARTRDRIIQAGAALFRRQGYAATGLKAIATESRAPFGSIYHFFPGGKDELTAEVIRAAGRAYGQLVPEIFDAEPDVAIATRNAFLGAAETLRRSGYEDACPIATVALEVASTNERLRQATAEVFGQWIALIADRYAGAGIAPAAARDLAMAVITNLEGAFVLARATRESKAVELAGEAMFAVVHAAQMKSQEGK